MWDVAIQIDRPASVLPGIITAKVSLVMVAASLAQESCIDDMMKYHKYYQHVLDKVPFIFVGTHSDSAVINTKEFNPQLQSLLGKDVSSIIIDSESNKGFKSLDKIIKSKLKVLYREKIDAYNEKPAVPSYISHQTRYQKFWNDSSSSALQRTLKVLENYTGADTYGFLFCLMHPCRHHIAAVNDVISNAKGALGQKEEVVILQEIFEQLKEIKDTNGSLSRRIQFIRDALLTEGIQPEPVAIDEFSISP